MTANECSPAPDGSVCQLTGPMKRSGISSMLHRFVGCFKPWPVQPGGHPTIPWGKIIAKPRSDGGYSLSVYYGIRIGWVRAGEVAPGKNVQAAMRNLARPVESLVPNASNHAER